MKKLTNFFRGGIKRKSATGYAKGLLSLLLGTCAIFTACTDDREIPDLTKSVLSLSVRNIQMTSRAVIESETLPDKSQIGVFLSEEGKNSYDSKILKNVLFEAAGTGDEQTWSTSEEIELSETEGILSAYYPYNEDVQEITNIPVDISTGHDYMYATQVEGVSKNNPQPVLSVNHALAAIRIGLKTEGYKGDGVVGSLKVYSKGFGKTAVLNAINGSLSQIKGSNTPVFYSVNENLSSTATYSDMMVVPTGTEDKVNIVLEVDGKVFQTITSSVNLTAGYIYNYMLVLKDTELHVQTTNVQPWENQVKVELDESFYLFSNSLEVTYNIGSYYVGKSVTLFNSSRLSDVKAMEINGMEVTPSATFTVPAEGLHKVKYVFNDMQTIPTSFLSGNSFVTEFIIPETIVTIKQSAFAGLTKLASPVVVPNSVVTIEQEAFYDSYISEIVLGSGLKQIGDDALRSDFECKTTKIISYAKEAPDYLLSSTYSSSYPFRYDNNGITVFYIPENAEGYDEWNVSGSVCFVEGDYINENGILFSPDRKKLHFVEVGSDVISIPDYVEEIGYGAFLRCQNHTGSIDIPNNVKKIGDYAFYSCENITSLTLNEGLESIGSNAFAHCTGISGELVVPSTLIKIDASAFHNNNFNTISVDENNTVYDSRENCNAIMETASNILVRGSNTTVIPVSTKKIGDYAFSGCTGLTSITLPENFEAIGSLSFYRCSSLLLITSYATEAPSIIYHWPTGSSSYLYCDSFNGMANNGVLRVPEGANYNTWMWGGSSNNYFLGSGGYNHNWTIEYFQ